MTWEIVTADECCGGLADSQTVTVCSFLITMSDLGGLVVAAGASPLRTDSGPQEHASAGTSAALAPQQSDNAVTSPMKGTPVNRILSGAVKVAGSLALVGGAMAAAAAPAGAAPSPTSAYGISAFGSGITINPVAFATVFN